MPIQPDSARGAHEQIHLGGETAVIVPLDEYQLLDALRKRATEEDLEESLDDVAIAEHEAWKAAGRPGGTVSHEEAMAELLRPCGGAQSR